MRRTHPCFDRPLETIAWAMLSIVCSFRPVLVLSTRHLNLFQLLQPRCAADQRVSQCESVSSGSAASEQRASARVRLRPLSSAPTRATPRSSNSAASIANRRPAMAELATAALDAMVEQVRDGRLPAENCLVAHAHDMACGRGAAARRII